MRFSIFLAAVVCAVAGLKYEPSMLVIGTHPDDEILCCAGVIYNAKKHGFKVRVALITSGEYFGDGRARALLRQSESIAALAHLGVSEDEVSFLGYPDAGLKTLMNEYNSSASKFTTTIGFAVFQHEKSFQTFAQNF